ncbi:hypothetical protein D3C72_1673100 [compost metagenome]
MLALVRRHDLARLVLRLPLEDLDQLGHLDAQRHRQVLGAVVLAPVSGLAEVIDGFLQVLDVDQWHGGMALASHGALAAAAPRQRGETRNLSTTTPARQPRHAGLTLHRCIHRRSGGLHAPDSRPGIRHPCRHRCLPGHRHRRLGRHRRLLCASRARGAHHRAVCAGRGRAVLRRQRQQRHA